MAQIAAELGFGSIRNFNRVFQKELGVSPRVYRNTDRSRPMDRCVPVDMEGIP